MLWFKRLLSIVLQKFLLPKSVWEKLQVNSNVFEYNKFFEGVVFLKTFCFHRKNFQSFCWKMENNR